MPKISKKTIEYGIAILLTTGIWLAIDNFLPATSYTVGVVTGTAYEETAQELYNRKRIKLYKDSRQSLHELSTGKVDAVILDRHVGLNIIKEKGYHNLKMAGKILNRKNIGIAFSRKDKALRQQIDRVLKEIINSDSYAGISNKYFGRNIHKGLEYSITYPEESPATDDSWNRRKRAGQLIFVMDGEAPFCYYNDQNVLTGFDVEIAQTVCSRLGVKFVPVPLTWEGIAAGLKAGHFDGVLGDMIITQQEEIDFSNPYYITGAQLFTTSDSLITGPETLEKPLFSLPAIKRPGELFDFNL